MVLNLRQLQKEAIIRILHFNAANRDLGEGKGEVFKVLVVDDFSLKIVATLLHTDVLRQHGVTLVLAINKDREAITDAPVVYFVCAVQDNAVAIVKDLEGGLYKEVRPHLRVGIVPKIALVGMDWLVRCDS
eukprot:jgi/Ulvmu1/1269/UM109_0067.1